MTDRMFFSVLGLAAFAMIALALVWPQGLGAPSWGPFGHPIQQPRAPVRAGPAPSLLPGLSAATGEQAAAAAAAAVFPPESSSQSPTQPAASQ